MRQSVAWLWAGAMMIAPAHSAVTDSSDIGFAVENSADLRADGAAVYRLLGQPALWWDGAHSYSGDAANLSLDARAGGCFCETIPHAAGAAGSVEHGRVIYAAPNRLLRLSGALGPLQGEAVVGTLTFDLAPAGAGTHVTMRYVVGGYMRMGARAVAPLVDQVLAAQLGQLKRAAEAGETRPRR